MPPARAALWALLLALPFTLSVAADPDLWWHVSAGRLILEQGIPATDPWNYAFPDAVWINHEWLPGMALAWTFDTLGPIGLLAVRGLVLVGLLTAWILAMERRLEIEALAVLLPGLAWPLLQHLCNLRPQTITWMLVPVLVVLLDQVARGRRWALIAVPITVIAWANLHGGFLFGWGLAGLGLLLTAAGVEETNEAGTGEPLSRRYRLACVGAVVPVALAPVLTPYGLGLPGYIWVELTTPHPDLPEWNPPELPMLLLLLAVALTPWLAWAAFRGRIRPTLWIGLLVATAQSLQHAKFIALVLLLAPLCLVEVLGPPLRAWMARDADLAVFLQHRATAVAAVAVALLASFTFWPATIGRIPIDPAIYPDRAVAWLDRAEAPDGARLLLPLGWGGIAIHHLYPRWQVGNDGRNTTVYPAAYVDAQARAWRSGDLAALLVSQPDVVLAPVKSPVADRLDDDPGWWSAYRDDTAVIFARMGSELRGPGGPMDVSGVFP